MTTKTKAPKAQAKPCPASSPSMPSELVTIPRAALRALAERAWPSFIATRYLRGCTHRDYRAPEDDYLEDLVKARLAQLDKAILLAAIRAQAQMEENGRIDLPLEDFMARLADIEGGRP